MARIRLSPVLFAVLLPLVWLSCLSSYQKPFSATIVSYNPQAFFDPRDDGTEYSDFKVRKGGWGKERYTERLERLALAVRDAGGRGPDVLCLVEIENEGVLADLAQGPLAAEGYTGLLFAPSPGQALSVGLLSRLPILEARVHGVSYEGKALRSILEAVLDSGGRRLQLFLGHWKSKLEGARETEAVRLAQAAVLGELMANARQGDPGAEVLACGDFNENPDEYERAGRSYATAFMPLGEDVPEGLSPIFLAGDVEEALASGSFYSPWPESGAYSYAYRGERERIDGFILAPGLIDGEGLSVAGFDVLAADFLVDDTGQPIRYDPERGTGYSDHLPIGLVLGFYSSAGSAP